VTITHPSHPYFGQALSVIRQHLKTAHPQLLIEMPDKSVQAMPLEWTDRSQPNPHRLNSAEGQRLSPLAALDLLKIVENNIMIDNKGER
jgi:hypothetical protein